MPRRIQGIPEDIPDDLFAGVQTLLQSAGFEPDDTAAAGVVLRAALDDGYKARVLRQSGNPAAEPWWQQVSSVIQQLDTTPFPKAETGTPEQPAPSASGGGLAALLSQGTGAAQVPVSQAPRAVPSQTPRRIPGQNPAGLRALLGDYLGGGR